MLKNALHTLLRYSLCFLIVSSIPSITYAAKDTLTYAWSTHVGPLNPHDYGANMMFAQNMVYESLINYGPEGKLLPGLATAWTISADKKTYTFTLRQGVVFSDGSPFNAQAVEVNFDAVFANKKRHDWLELIERIASYKALDAHTFSITLHKPYAAALQELTFVRPLRFASPAMVEALRSGQKNVQPVGTGPWIWQERKKGHYDLFVRNEKHWNATAWPTPGLKKVIVKVIPDAEARAVALETGSIDIIATVMGDHGTAEIQPDAYALFVKDADYATTKSSPRNTRIIAMNAGRGPLQDLQVRKAIMRAIDRAGILQGVLLGQELTAEQLMSQDLPHCNVSLPPYPFDVSAANALLDAAGWKKKPGAPFRQKDGKPLRLTLTFVAHESLMRSIAQVVQSNLASIGIELSLIGKEGVAFMDAQRVGDFDLIFANSSGSPYAPYSYLGIMQVPGHPEYQAQRHIAQKKALDVAMEKALNAADDTEAKQHFADIWRIIHEAEIYVPLSFTVDKALYKKSVVKSFSFSPVSYELNLHNTVKK